tara:strand:+ start:354 stop:623 length:270 start_codon:yes stop_codon:yes gene_type:complete
MLKIWRLIKMSITYYSLNELIEFLESNPKKNDIEKYYLNKILIHTKDSIIEILEHNLNVLKNQLKKSNSNLLIKKCNRIKNILKKYEVK